MHSPQLNGDKKPSRWKRLWYMGTTWLIHTRLAFHLALLAMILTLPALWLGWQLDDHLHRTVMMGLSPFKSGHLKIFSAFTFFNGDSETIRRLMDLGVLPWWTSPHFRIEFFRYLSSLTMWLDYRLWPDWPSLMHLHSLLWYAGLVAAATCFYRQIMGPAWVAGLAALLYAVDDAHALPAAWLANRNALLAAFFGILCLTAYDGWRRLGKKWCALAHTACLALALLSGELALAVAGYLLAYTLFLDQSRLSRRFLALLPAALVLLAWAILYWSFDFGTKGSGFYINPLISPVEFIRALVHRGPFLLLGQWSPLPAELGTIISGKWILIFFPVLLAFLVFLLFPLIRLDKIARFWLLGMTLSLVPIAGVVPGNRLLLFVGLGAMGLLAQLLSGLIEKPGKFPGRPSWRIPALTLGIFLMLFHLILSPLCLPGVVYSLKPLGEFFASPVKTVSDDPKISRQDLIVVNPPDYLFSINLIGALKILEGKPIARSIRALSGGPVPLEIQRLDQCSLRVKIHGGLFQGVTGRLYRSQEEPLTLGQEIHLRGLSARVTRMDQDYGPEEVVYRFPVPLEDASLRWLKWEKGTYVPFIPPPIGKSVRFSGIDPFDFFQRQGPS